MGDNQRGWAEIAEQAVAEGLNGGDVDVYIQQVSDAICQHLTILYPRNPIIRAEWIGGDSYDDPGDVVAYLESDDIVNIELKFSHGRGSGTNKNPGAGFFNKKISTDIMSYNEFDLPYRQRRLDYLSRYTGKTFKNYSAYCRELRAIRDSADQGNQDHANVLKAIADITNPGQAAYAEYAAAKLNNHLPRVNQVAKELLNLDGDEVIKQEVVYCVIKQFESPNQTVEFYDYSEMDRQITKVVATGQSIKFLNASGKDVFRFAVNWKNICQGGSTPSFNVWVGRAFK